jgi:hypothetical protein
MITRRILRSNTVAEGDCYRKKLEIVKIAYEKHVQITYCCQGLMFYQRCFKSRSFQQTYHNPIIPAKNMSKICPRVESCDDKDDGDDREWRFYPEQKIDMRLWVNIVWSRPRCDLLRSGHAHCRKVSLLATIRAAPNRHIQLRSSA